MKQKILTTLIGLFLINLTFGQDKEKYAELTQEAYDLLQAKEYINSAKKYEEAFVEFNGKAEWWDRYNVACSYSLSANPDPSFYHLFRLANDSKYDDHLHITNDPDLIPLYKDKRWNELISLVKTNKEKKEANWNKPLVAILDTVFDEDQKYRLQMDEIEQKYGWESNEIIAHWRLINRKDSINLIKIKKILDEKGWLGADIIGKQGNSTLFLVIQHADPGTQRKYLPLMREAVQKGNASPSSLALLEDRVALGQGKRQIYGSQVGRDQESGEYYVLPLEDPNNVDKRRATVGLGTLQDYIANWGMTWNGEEYIKKLPELESKEKK